MQEDLLKLQITLTHGACPLFQPQTQITFDRRGHALSSKCFARPVSLYNSEPATEFPHLDYNGVSLHGLYFAANRLTTQAFQVVKETRISFFGALWVRDDDPGDSQSGQC